MHFSDLLSEKLNSDIALSKRIQLAKNVFISVDLRIAYKEECILIWFFHTILDTEDEEKERELIKGLYFCVNSQIMTLLPASGIRADAKSNISKLITKILKLSKNIDMDLINSIFIILKKFSLHYKSHYKKYVKILCALLNLNMIHFKFGEILRLSSDIFKSEILLEKFVLHLLEKDFHLLFKNFDETDSNNYVLIQFLQKMFFKNEIFNQFEVILHSICSGHEISVNNPIILALLSSMHNIFTYDLDVNLKRQAFSKVFEAFAKSSGNEESTSILQFFIVLCHLIGLEQIVELKQHSDSVELAKSIINKTHFQKIFNIPSVEANETSYIVVNSLIEVLSSYSPNLNIGLCNSTYLQWFQSFILTPISHEKLLNIHLDFFCTCSDLNTSIMEKNFSKIFSHILKLKPETFKNEKFKTSFNQFMENMLTMYSKLQRIQKFILKLLKSIQCSITSLTAKNVLPNNFVLEFSNLITLMPSMQALSFMDDLLETINIRCVKILEENNEPLNVLLIQVTCALLAAFLRGVRVLSHTTPQGILKPFIEKNRQIKEILGRFGKALLVRIHDREVVQPFLNLSFYWGEFELLIMCYVEDHAEELVNKDISPPDLSTLHSYLRGEEWNILAERVYNFGAEQCYQLFLKLIVQKLRTLQLKNCSSLINGEETSRHILTQFTSELYKHNIVEELSPEDAAFLLSYLPQRLSYLLLDRLYTKVIEVEKSGEVLDWISDSILLEKRNFIVLSLVLIFKKIGSMLNSVEHNGTSGIPFEALCLDFVNENYRINENEYFKLVGHLNELLNDGAIFSSDKVKLAQMKIFVDIITCLPLVYMPPEISSLALSGSLFLAIVFSSIEELLKPLLLLIYKLTIATSRTSSFSCFNVGLCIKWLLYMDGKDEEIQKLKNNLIKLLLKIRTSKGTELNEVKELINFMRKKLKEDPKSLGSQILLYQDLGKSWTKSRSRKRNEKNEEISKFRKKLSKHIRKELERQNEMETPTVDCEVLVMAYGIELTRAIKLKEEDNILSLLKLNFEKFFDVSVAEIKNGSKKEGYVTFLTTILTHMPQVKEHLKNSTLETIWNTLKISSKVDWKLFYRVANEKEFEFFLLDLLKTWKVFSLGENHNLDLETYFHIWREFYTSDDPTHKTLYEKYLERLFVDFSAGIVAINNFTPEQSVQLFSFIRFCIATDEIVMTSAMLDTSIDILYCYDYKEKLSHKEFQKVFESCINAVSWSSTARSVRMKDKIHNIFQLFVKLLDALGKRSSAKSYVSEEDLLALSSCAHNMEKWTSKMVKYSKDFSRMSVYFIACLVSSFVKINFYPAIKAPLVNCVHNFLSISDSHNISHLVRVFSPGSQQVFNTIYETYKKYYKFTGKV